MVLLVYRCPCCEQQHTATTCCCGLPARIRECRLGCCIGKAYQLCNRAPPRCSHACFVTNQGRLEYNFEAERQTMIYRTADLARSRPACIGLTDVAYEPLWDKGLIMFQSKARDPLKGKSPRDRLLLASAPYLSNFPHLSLLVKAAVESQGDLPQMPIPVAYGGPRSIFSSMCSHLCTRGAGNVCELCLLFQEVCHAELLRKAAGKASCHQDQLRALANRKPLQWPKPMHATPLENHLALASKKREFKAAKQVSARLLCHYKAAAQ